MPDRKSPSEREQELTATTYDELRGLAAAHLARLRPGQTLQPTALVHEAWMRVSRQHGELSATDERRYFFFALGRAMRDVLVEEARRRDALKRGGGARNETLHTGLVHMVDSDADVLAVHEALAGLEAESPDHAQVVVLRFFGGLTMEETAAALGTSLSSVERRWRFCKAWLRRQMS